MNKPRKKSMFIIIGVFLILIGALMIWFAVPYSPVKKQFQNDTAALSAENKLPPDGEPFTENDFLHLPIAVQKYIENCGYTGTPKMSYLKMEYNAVNFSQGGNGSVLKIDYTRYNFINEPCRMALIDSRLCGIPFEGYDYYQNGSGGMKGVIAKAVRCSTKPGRIWTKRALLRFLQKVCLPLPFCCKTILRLRK